MSDLPPTIDAILESIRQRVTGPEAPADAPAEPPPPPAPPPPDLAAVAVPATITTTTLDAFLRELLQPMIRQWLDANLPEIVEKVAQAEIRRLTGRG